MKITQAQALVVLNMAFLGAQEAIAAHLETMEADKVEDFGKRCQGAVMDYMLRCPEDTKTGEVGAAFLGALKEKGASIHHTDVAHWALKERFLGAIYAVCQDVGQARALAKECGGKRYTAGAYIVVTKAIQ